MLHLNYRIGIDVGGTFTDFLLVDGEGNSKVYKTLSTPDDPTVGFFNGIVEMAKDHNMKLVHFLEKVSLIVHGTTVGTNAALTYSGAETILLTTEGFRDVLQMRRGLRPDAYNNQFVQPEPFVKRRFRKGIKGRVAELGQEVEPLDVEEVENVIELIKENDIEAIAISFMHSYANNAHEKKVGEMLKSAFPDKYITLSSDLVPRAGLYNRTSTTVLNSYIGPIINRYFSKLIERLDGYEFKGTLLIMQSNGGVATPERTIKKAANTLLSGPASAPIAGNWYLEDHEITSAITMDMGGTSFDISILKDRKPQIRTEGEIANWPISLPTVDIVTIGAGGGSIAWVDGGGLLHVGPKSAGAKPGPACYGLGGELPTVTDANLVLGYLDPDYFLGGKMKLDYEKAYIAIKDHIASKLNISVLQAAKGIIDMVNVNMANGIREATIQRGEDPREFPLVSAGGAGPAQVAAIAKELDSQLVIIPKESSIFCAVGMLMSDLRHDYVKVYRAGTKKMTIQEVQSIFDELIKQGKQTLKAEGLSDIDVAFEYSIDMMYEGQFFEVNVPFSEEEIRALTIESMEQAFHDLHEKLFGYKTTHMPVEVTNFNLSTIGKTIKPQKKTPPYHGTTSEHALKKSREAALGKNGEMMDVNIYDGHNLFHGNQVEGPAIIEQVVTTIVVPADCSVICDKNDNYILYEKAIDERTVNSFVEKERGWVNV